MPTYEYECQKCGHEFEVFQSIVDKPLSRCPKCRGKVRKLISQGAGIIFKGSGFYQTDYRSRSYKQAAEKDKAPSSAPAASSSDKSSSADKGSAGASSTTSAKSDAKPAADKK